MHRRLTSTKVGACLIYVGLAEDFFNQEAVIRTLWELACQRLR